jgi:hypothetical protein
MAYEKMDEADRAKMIKADNEMQNLIGKIRADVQSSPDLKPGIMYVLKLAKLYFPTIWYKRIGEALVTLSKELL